VVNSGNANAFTGMKGRETVRISADHAARALGIDPGTVFLASTGVIGEPLDPSKFAAVLDDTAARLADGPWIDAARAIMTTDTFPKVATRTADLGGVPVTINGIAKGAGMIAPDMATMLSFVFTDAPIAAPALQAMLSAGVERSFNAITIDSDTSTSDTLVLFATGAALSRGAPRIENPDDPRLEDFRAALDGLLLDLAHQVVRDGEGARKFVEVTVTGAVDDASAKRIALSAANSPLVKTAIAGEDANWGRIVMAVGKAGEPADRDRLAIWFGDVRVAVEGARDPSYSEAAASAVMKQDEIAIRVDLGLGSGRATVWTCDLTKEYVAINGDYRS
jgi:glutamate N-acetyltransferase/amino-acid N-acetyltransferase